MRRPALTCSLKIATPALARAASAVAGVLELDRRVAGVQAQAHVAAQGRFGLGRAPGRCRRRTGPGPRPTNTCCFRKRRPSVVVSSRHSGSGSSASASSGPPASRSRHSVAACAGHRPGHRLRGPGIRRPRPEAAGHRADRTVGARGRRRQQPGQHLGHVLGVALAFRLQPVGAVHRLLHRRSVEGAVGEGVDREHVQVVPGQQRLQVRQRRRGPQLGRGRPRQAQADAERSGRAPPAASPPPPGAPGWSRTSAQVSPGWMLVQ